MFEILKKNAAGFVVASFVVVRSQTAVDDPFADKRGLAAEC